MGDSETLTIRAEMLSDIPEKAAEDAAAFKSMVQEMQAGNDRVRLAVDELGQKLDGQSRKHADVAAGASKLSSAYRDLYEQGTKLREGISSIGETITERLRYPLQQMTWALEGATAGMVLFGLTTASSLQQANLQLTALTGNSTLAASATAQLRGLQGAVGLEQLTGGYAALTQAGMPASQIMPTMTGLNNLAAVSGNPDQSMGAMSGALQSMMETGLISTSDVNAFQSANVPIWQILSQMSGQSQQELQYRFERAGTPMEYTPQFLSALMGTQNAKTGSAQYNATWEGQFAMLKKSAGNFLAVFEQPLGSALAGASTKIDSWATRTENRFKQMSPTMSAEWRSGNIGGLSSTLAQVLGNNKLAPVIDAVTVSVRSFGRAVVPVGEDLLTVATPALHAFSDVLSFMSDHSGATEALIVTLGGFMVLSKVASWANSAATALRLFSTVAESGSLIKGLQMFGAGAGKLGTAETIAGGAAGGSIAATAEPILAGIGGYAAAWKLNDYATSKKHAKTGSGDLAWIASHAIDPEIGISQDLFHGITGLFGAHHLSATHIDNVNITVPGSGNPNRVANSIPGALQSQLAAVQGRSVRRSG